jgi:hypothetical protein
MKKYFLIVLLVVAGLTASRAQYTEERKADSLKIDSMKKALPQLRGSARVDCLNTIHDMDGGVFIVGPLIWQQRHDSITKYAAMAYTEATSIGYQKGVLLALLGLGRSELYFAKNLSNAEKYLRLAVDLAKKVNNDTLSGNAYALYADCLAKNNDDNSITANKQAIFYYHKSGVLEREAEWTTWLAGSYIGRGNYEEGFPYCVKAVELTKQSAHSEWGYEMVQFALSYMSELYQIVGDYETSMDYLRQAEQYLIVHGLEGGMEEGKARLFNQMGQTDSAFYYWQKVVSADPNNPFMKMSFGETYLSTKEYDKALKLFLPNIDSIRNFKSEQHLLVECLLDIGKAYAGKKDYAAALKYAKEGFDLAQKYYSTLIFDGRSFMVEGNELLADIYHHLGKDDIAYNYLKEYTTLNDSIQKKQFSWRLNNQLNNYKREAEDQKKQARILLLNKDNQIKDAQLKQASTTKNFLIGSLFVLFVAGIFIYRSITLKRKTEKLQREKLENEFKVQQLENEKRQAELQQQAAELEMQALRAQMNPHFIFNCLSSINRIILKNETQSASDYLTRFSRLIRMVLINSQKSMIALEDELHMVRLYLDMERLRFKNSFDYGITFTNTIDEGAVSIPPLLLQPFCENAIWHGLMQKEEQGHLYIELSMQNDILHCIISDDGIGRENAAALKSKSAEKEKSMGLTITAQRLALLNRNKNVQTLYTIEDILDENKNIAGTKVILKIACKELTEQVV